MLDSTSMIAYDNSGCSSKEHSYDICVSSLESLGNYDRQKLLELELSLSYYLNLPLRENDESVGQPY